MTETNRNELPEGRLDRVANGPGGGPVGLWRRISESLGLRLQHQLEVATSAFGVLTNVGSLLVQLGALIAAVASIAGATVSTMTLREFGIEPYDYLSVSELPALGLRFLPAVLFTAVILAGVGILFAFAALTAAHAVQSHRDEMNSVRHATRFRKGVAWLGSITRNGKPYLIPLFFGGVVSVQTTGGFKALAEAQAEVIRSEGACNRYVTWSKTARESGSTPFSAKQCASLIGVFGGNTMLFANNATHILPAGIIAHMRVETQVPDAALKGQ